MIMTNSRAVMPRLAIVVVNWNTCEILADCLHRVRAAMQSASLEVWVVDNASTDGSADMVAALFPEFHLIRNSENVGFAAANNQAFERIESELVLLLNSDALLLPGALENCIRYMAQHPAVGAMGCRVLNADGTLQKSASLFPTVGRLLAKTLGVHRIPGLERSFRYRSVCGDGTRELPVEVLSGCFLMTRKDVLREVGFLDERFFFFGEETDWCLRCRQAGHELRYAPVADVVHLGGASATRLEARRDLLLTSSFIALHRKHFGRLSAALVWITLLFFNASRFVYWSIRNRVRPSQLAGARSRLFRGVLFGFHRVWGTGAIAS